jgi:hypothetical protein
MVIEAEQRWAKLSLDVCHVCDVCHLIEMSKTMVERGRTNQREQKPVCGSCANNPSRNTAQNGVIPCWLDGHGTIHADAPRELSDIIFAKNQLIAAIGF